MPSTAAPNPTALPRIAIFISGRGSNMEALLDAMDRGTLPATCPLVVSNTAKAAGLKRAWERNIPAYPLNPARYPTLAEYEADLLRLLAHYRIDAIALAGYLKPIPDAIIARYPGRIFNIHPSLLPKHGGFGMYGPRVHAAVLAAGELETGVSVHVVTAAYDEGPVIAQERVPVLAEDTPESLAERVLAVEHRLYPQALAEALRGCQVNSATVSSQDEDGDGMA